MSNYRRYTEGELADLVRWREHEGLTWDKVADRFEKRYKDRVAGDTLRKQYDKVRSSYDMTDDAAEYQQLTKSSRVHKRNTQLARENRLIQEFAMDADDVVAALKSFLVDVKPPKLPKQRVSKSKGPRMTKELLLSDIHYGKLIVKDGMTKFDLDICRARMQQITRKTIDDIIRDKAHYNVEKLVIGLLGDIIESETMHGLESARGCEFGNPEQVEAATKSLFQDVIYPLAMAGRELGFTVDIDAICGNHDRSEKDKTFHLPGRYHWTWVIYNHLQDCCTYMGLDNVTFRIPESSYIVREFYGTSYLYEHGDRFRSYNLKSAEEYVAKRAAQLKTILAGMRFGHFHTSITYGPGSIIANGSVCGGDSYAEVLGFATIAGQTLSSYVETENRPTSFFKTFTIYLGEV